MRSDNLTSAQDATLTQAEKLANAIPIMDEVLEIVRDLDKELSKSNARIQDLEAER
jgi:hypothetical protein